MFGIPKDELLENLENLRRRVCCYMTPDRCDCKYGIEWVEQPTKEEAEADPEAAQKKMKKAMSQFQDFRGVGEQTGCPELRQAIALIQSIPDDEFKKWNNAAHIHIADDELQQIIQDALNGKGVSKYLCCNCKKVVHENEVAMVGGNTPLCYECVDKAKKERDRRDQNLLDEHRKDISDCVNRSRGKK